MIATSSRPGLHGVEADRLASAIRSSSASKFAVPSKPITFFRKRLVFAAVDQLVHQPRVAERELHLRLVDHLGQIGGAQRRHGVDDDRAGLQRREPAGDHRRIVGGADQDAVAGHDAEVLDQRAGEPVGPVGKLLVGAQAAVADQRGVVAKALLDHAVGQLDARR